MKVLPSLLRTVTIRKLSANRSDTERYKRNGAKRASRIRETNRNFFASGKIAVPIKKTIPKYRLQLILDGHIAHSGRYDITPDEIPFSDRARRKTCSRGDPKTPGPKHPSVRKRRGIRKPLTRCE